VGINELIYPLFLTSGSNIKTEISSMPGIFSFSKDLLYKEIEECLKLGINTFAPFPHVEESLKDKYAKESHNSNGLYLSAIKEIKSIFPEACLMTDVGMDPYSSD